MPILIVVRVVYDSDDGVLYAPLHAHIRAQTFGEGSAIDAIADEDADSTCCCCDVHVYDACDIACGVVRSNLNHASCD